MSAPPAAARKEDGAGGRSRRPSRRNRPRVEAAANLIGRASAARSKEAEPGTAPPRADDPAVPSASVVDDEDEFGGMSSQDLAPRPIVSASL
jgi:hypothetical protein